MKEHILKTIEDVEAVIRASQAFINQLCRLAEEPPRYPLTTGLAVEFTPPSLAERIPFLADREDIHGHLPEDRRMSAGPKPAKSRPGPKATAFAATVATVLALRELVPAEFTTRDLRAQDEALDKDRLGDALKALVANKTLRVVRDGGPGKAGIYAWRAGGPAVPKAVPPPGGKFLLGRKDPATTAARPEPRAEKPQPKAALAANLKAPAQPPAERLTARSGETADEAVRRTVELLPAPFTRLDVDEFCPSGFTGVQIGEALAALRKKEIIAHDPSQAVGANRPTSYVRGPAFHA